MCSKELSIAGQLEIPRAVFKFQLKDGELDVSNGYHICGFLHNLIQDLGFSEKDAEVVNVPLKNTTVEVASHLVRWLEHMYAAPVQASILLQSPFFQMDETTYVQSLRQLWNNVLDFDSASHLQAHLEPIDAEEDQIFATCRSPKILRDLLCLSIYLDCVVFYRRLLFSVRKDIGEAKRFKEIRSSLCPHNNPYFLSPGQWFDFLVEAGINPQARHIACTPAPRTTHASTETDAVVDIQSIPIESSDAVFMVSFDNSLIACSICGFHCENSETEIVPDVISTVGCQRIAAHSDTLGRYAKWLSCVPPFCPSADIDYGAYDNFFDRMAAVKDTVSHAEIVHFQKWQELYPSAKDETQTLFGPGDLDEKKIARHLNSYIEIIGFTKDTLLQIHLEVILANWHEKNEKRLDFINNLILPFESCDEILERQIAEVREFICTERHVVNFNQRLIAAFCLIWHYVEFIEAHELDRPTLPSGEKLEAFTTSNQDRPEVADMSDLEKTQLEGRGGMTDTFTLGTYRMGSITELHRLARNFVRDPTRVLDPDEVECLIDATTLAMHLFVTDDTIDWDMVSNFDLHPMASSFMLAHMYDITVDFSEGGNSSLSSQLETLYVRLRDIEDELTNTLLDRLTYALDKEAQAAAFTITENSSADELSQCLAKVWDYMVGVGLVYALPTEFSLESLPVRILKNIEESTYTTIKMDKDLWGYLVEVNVVAHEVQECARHFREEFCWYYIDEDVDEQDVVMDSESPSMREENDVLMDSTEDIGAGLMQVDGEQEHQLEVKL